MTDASNTLTLDTTEEEVQEFRRDVIAGFSKPAGKRRLPSRYLYDQRGCELFEAICQTPEYYLTRTELGIMRANAAAMASVLGPQCRLVELGSGASIKTQWLLDCLEDPAAYVPVDVSADYLIPSCERLSQKYSDLVISPVCANFTESFQLPDTPEAQRTVVYFPGSTIGNFTPQAAVELLSNMRSLVGPGGGMLIGMDLKKDVAVLEAAYNDAAGVTAMFTANLLVRMQRDLDAKLQRKQFEHLARYNPQEGRIEIYLCSLADQEIEIDGERFEFAQDELINTEYSYKYDLLDAQRFASEAGMAMTHAWLDERNWFGVFYFTYPDLTT